MPTSLVTLLTKEAEALKAQNEEQERLQLLKTQSQESQAKARDAVRRERATIAVVKEYFKKVFPGTELMVRVCTDKIERGGFGINGGVHQNLVAVNDLLFFLDNFRWEDNEVDFSSYWLLFAKPSVRRGKNLVQRIFIKEVKGPHEPEFVRETIRQAVAEHPGFIFESSEIFEAIRKAANDEELRHIESQRAHQ